MTRIILRLIMLTTLVAAVSLHAEPTPTLSAKRSSSGVQKAIVQSANGWSYVKGEWVHPDGYKYVNGKVLRTTARRGKAVPRPPGKLALENAQKLTPTTVTAPATAKTEAERKAEERRKNLTPTAAPQTGSHL
jgi:hypothetical protein